MFLRYSISYIDFTGEYSEYKTPEFKKNNELIEKLLKMGLEFQSYGENLDSIIIIYPKSDGYFTFGVKDSPRYVGNSAWFNSSSLLTHAEKRTFTRIERVGLFKREKECQYEREVTVYKLCDELQTICRAFAERGKKDSVEIAFELKGYGDYSPVAKISKFDEEMITVYSEEDHTNRSCLAYRVEF